MGTQSFSALLSTKEIMIISIVVLATSIWMIAATWSIFKRAGEPGWKSIIPIYNIFTLCKIAFGSGLYFLLLLVPIVNIIVSIMLYYKLGKRFDKGIGFCVGLVLFPIFFIPLLAFPNEKGKSRISVFLISLLLSATLIIIPTGIALSAMDRQNTEESQTGTEETDYTSDFDEDVWSDESDDSQESDSDYDSYDDQNQDQDQDMGNAGVEEDTNTYTNDQSTDNTGTEDQNTFYNQDQSMGTAGTEEQ